MGGRTGMKPEVSFSVRTKVHMWWTWLQIASHHVGAARNARAGNVTPASYEAIDSAALSREFEAALVAMASVSFAMEALESELESAGHVLDKTSIVVPKN